MRVVYLHQYFNTPDMPFGTRSYEMSRRLAAAGHSVDVIAADRSAEKSAPRWRISEISGVRVHWVKVKYSDRQSIVRRLGAFVSFAWFATIRAVRLKSDLIFATSTPLTIAIPALIASRLRRVPMVFEVRDLWPEVPIALGVLKDPLSRSLARLLERAAYAGSRYVIALAPGMGEGVVRAGYPANRVVVIPNGSDLDLFSVGDGGDVRLAHDWLKDRPMVLYAGAIGLVNGVDYLVRVARRAGDLGSDAVFVVVGTGGQEEAVRTLAADLGVLNENFYMVGVIPKCAVPDWMSAATICIALLTGPREVWKDSTSNKFFDALAAGKPVANNFDGWSARIAADQGAGVILPQHDPVRGAEILCGLLEDSQWLEQARDSAHRLAREDFNRDRLADSFIRTLERAAAEGPGRIALRSPTR